MKTTTLSVELGRANLGGAEIVAAIGSIRSDQDLTEQIQVGRIFEIDKNATDAPLIADIYVNGEPAAKGSITKTQNDADIPVYCAKVTELTGEADYGLTAGQFIELDTPIVEQNAMTMNIVAGGEIVAKGELCGVGTNIGIRVTEIA